MKWTLKAIRTNLNYSQIEMAKKLGISKKTYQKYENYKTFPNVSIIKKIIEISNISFDDIIFLPSEYAESEKNEN